MLNQKPPYYVEVFFKNQFGTRFFLDFIFDAVLDEDTISLLAFLLNLQLMIARC